MGGCREQRRLCMARDEPTGDPIKVMDIIAVGLGRVDHFDYNARRYKLGREPDPPSGKVERVGPDLEIRHGGYTYQVVSPTDLNLNAWDEAKESYYALDRLITPNLDYYNELLAQLATMTMSDDERHRIEQRVETVQKHLCEDFREMVALDQQVLQLGLPDHYWLVHVCGPPQ